MNKKPEISIKAPIELDAVIKILSAQRDVMGKSASTIYDFDKARLQLAVFLERESERESNHAAKIMVHDAKASRKAKKSVYKIDLEALDTHWKSFIQRAQIPEDSFRSDDIMCVLGAYRRLIDKLNFTKSIFEVQDQHNFYKLPDTSVLDPRIHPQLKTFVDDIRHKQANGIQLSANDIANYEHVVKHVTPLLPKTPPLTSPELFAKNTPPKGGRTPG